MKSVIYILLISLCFVACGPDTNEAVEKDTPVRADSAIIVTANSKEKLNDSHPGSEINDYTDMNLDSMRVRYQSTFDTLYGYRNKDTLLIEGDIKIVYPSHNKGARGVGTTNGLWPKLPSGRVVIPYQVRPDYKHESMVEEALKMWQKELPNIRFVKQNFELDYIIFVPSKYTQSNIGRIGGVQTIELSGGALTGNIVHEIGHAIGLYHEQSRSDRDAFVKIACPDDINYRHAYKTDPYSVDIGPYNYNSIMHYPPTECLTFPASLPADANPGQRLRITPGDFAAIKRIYHFQ